MSLLDITLKVLKWYYLQLVQKIPKVTISEKDLMFVIKKYPQGLRLEKKPRDKNNEISILRWY